MKKQYKYSKKEAKEKINEYFDLAKKAFKKNPSLADRYIDKARKVGMKNRVRIPKALQRQFCKHCYSYLMPGVNCRVRNQSGKMVYFCKHCKKFMRFPLD